MFEEVTIGECRLILGDCREVLPMLPAVDLLMTDPPYGIGADAAAHKASGTVVGHGHRRVAKRTYEQTEWDTEAPPEWLIGLMLAKAQHQIIFGGNYYALPPTSCILVWDKKTNGNFADCELAWTNLPKAVRRIECLWNGFAREGNEERFDHPTQKPVKVIEWAMRQAPDDVETVCDPFMGSGTTGVACARMGLQFVGIERERKYFDIACRRIEQAYAQPRLFEDAKIGAGDTAVQGDMLLPANGQAQGPSPAR